MVRSTQVIFRSLIAALVVIAITAMPSMSLAQCAKMCSAKQDTADARDEHACCKTAGKPAAADHPSPRHHDASSPAPCLSACCTVPCVTPGLTLNLSPDQATTAIALPIFAADGFAVSHAIFHPPRG